MPKAHDPKLKQEILDRVAAGETPYKVAKDHGVSTGVVYGWVSAAKKERHAKEDHVEQAIDRDGSHALVVRRIAKLTAQRDALLKIVVKLSESL